ncbi:MAG: hypothetical protein JXR97_01185 [Planctomycetes bacterium]|nr:hypothetical protein [Planctomycetota bacterium]
MSALVLLACVCGYGAIRLYRSRIQYMISRWATENGYTVLEANAHMFRRGPYAWFSVGRGQVVLKARVRDFAGNEKVFWLLCGSYWFGLFSDEVEARTE